MLNDDEIRFLVYGTDFYDATNHFEKNYKMILSGCHMNYRNAQYKDIVKYNKNKRVVCYWDDLLKIRIIQQDLENDKQ
jgi:hypothetical protein